MAEICIKSFYEQKINLVHMDTTRLHIRDRSGQVSFI